MPPHPARDPGLIGPPAFTPRVDQLFERFADEFDFAKRQRKRLREVFEAIRLALDSGVPLRNVAQVLSYVGINNRQSTYTGLTRRPYVLSVAKVQTTQRMALAHHSIGHCTAVDAEVDEVKLGATKALVFRACLDL